MSTHLDGCTPAQINMGVALQSSRIRLAIIENVQVSDPYSNVFDGGTLEANVGETITTTVPGRVVLNQSMTIPETIAKTQLCGQVGPAASYGMTTYTAQMRAIRGRGPDLCVHQAFHAVDRALSTMETGLNQMVKEHMAADDRAILLQMSGHKFVAHTGAGFFDMLTGADRAIAVDFAALGVPNSTMPFKALVKLSRHLQETAQVQTFGDGDGAHAVFIAGSDLLDIHRNETGVREDTLALVQGSDREATAALKRFQWSMSPYRGIRTAVDTRPLRFNTVDGDNMPRLLEPYHEVATDDGTEWRIRQEWLEAAYEVAFLVFKGTFRRLVPSRFTKAGEATWPAQFTMGELEWTNFRSQNCNEYGDTGHFIYQIIRAFEPVMPWAVVPILHKRCAPDLGFASCQTVSEAG